MNIAHANPNTVNHPVVSSDRWVAERKKLLARERELTHLRDQIAHNLKKGVLKSTASGEVKYSWRGMIYLWCQFLLDLVRL